MDSVLQNSYKSTIKPLQHKKILLGDYKSFDDIKGFVIELPDPVNVHDVSSSVVCFNTDDGVRLFMNIINFGNKAVEIHIKKL